MRFAIFFPLAFLLLLAAACQPDPPLFRPVDSRHSGIRFSNDLVTNDTFNAVVYEYIYNGGGVAAGDVNGDGWVDLFFTGNQVSSRLYLNRGGLRFEDVTEAAGVGTDRWCTGVAMADVNDDGRLDIYVSVAGFQVPEARMANLLFINEGWDEAGIPRFAEQAAAYGLDDRGYSTQGAFFDYDRDGDLDCYLLTNAMERYNRNNLRPKRTNGEAPSTDRLYRNEGNGRFTDVSREAGILIEGYGLGVSIADLNDDGWPDVYTANDFLSNDLVWVNNGDGTFTNRAADYLKHQTHNGMGVDVADINNDALPDIAVLDMLPEDNYRQKMMISFANYDLFYMRREMGYQDQYMRNTLQLHRGFLPGGEPRFSEIGFLAGLAGTDWSWAVLFSDLNLDGWKDALITNGYRKDVTNLDYINYSNANQLFGTAEAKKQKAIEDLHNAPDVEVNNYLFRNEGNLRFTDVSETWGLGAPSFSNGAAYADLDNDGDLDLVVNNIDSEASLYENRRREQAAGEAHFLAIDLRENSPDLVPNNTKVWVYAGGQAQYQEYNPYRGYKSTVDHRLYFGLGEQSAADSVIVVWPDGRISRRHNVAADQWLTIAYPEEAAAGPPPRPLAGVDPLFRNNEPPVGLRYRHDAHYFSDLNVAPTLPHEPSKAGPPLATGDLNGDRLPDLVVGGNAGQPLAFFFQTDTGGFVRQPLPFDADRKDTGCLLFDADGDGDLDLYVVSGGGHRPAGDAAYQDRLYRNDGAGNFQPAPAALPAVHSSGSCVRAADYDGDGDADLFVGGRYRPGQYPLPARSFLLRNDGGRFTDVTPEVLREPGLVTDAAWTDYDGDGRPDLLLAGEWMPLTCFRNDGATLHPTAIDVTDAENGRSLPTDGWWFHLRAADFDGDGDEDLLAGNLGLNSKLKASPEQPVQILAKDFDNNGGIDPLITHYVQGKPYVLQQRDLLIKQIPGMKRRFPDYQSYAEAPLDRTLYKKDLTGAYVAESRLFASVLLENTGDGRFRLHRLPTECQFAPLQASLLLDINDDGRPDLLTAGNLHAAETMQLGWYDASYGNVLLNRGGLQFESVNPLAAGFAMDGDVRSLARLPLQNGQQLIVGGVCEGEMKVLVLGEAAPEL